MITRDETNMDFEYTPYIFADDIFPKFIGLPYSLADMKRWIYADTNIFYWHDIELFNIRYDK